MYRQYKIKYGYHDLDMYMSGDFPSTTLIKVFGCWLARKLDGIRGIKNAK